MRYTITFSGYRISKHPSGEYRVSRGGSASLYAANENGFTLVGFVSGSSPLLQPRIDIPQETLNTIIDRLK